MINANKFRNRNTREEVEVVRSETITDRKPYFKFKSYLDEKGIRQKDVAKLIGKNPAVVNQNINGVKGDFTNREVQLICRTYGISADEFFFDG